MDRQTTKLKDDAKAMPPPPPPRPVLLEPEIESLRRCLQHAMLKTGQVYAFYADTRRLGVSKYANNPPQALGSALGRELENYDQLCDAIESHLLRAIAVLQRDLQREEKKQEAILREQEAQKKSQVLQETHPVEEFQFTEPAPPSSAEFTPTNPRNSPAHPGVGPMNTRRPSAISISSLQRPSLPPKLDLSSSSRHMTAEENSGTYPSGLASPVTLAPKSARPIGTNEFQAQFMSAFSNTVDSSVIDLTILPEDDDHHQMKPNIDSTAGNSSDKPIELDLDMPDMGMSMNDLFVATSAEPSRGTTEVGNMFGMTGTATNSHTKPTKENELIDLTTQDLFASLSNNTIAPAPNLRTLDHSATVETPSPSALLAAGFTQHLSSSNSLESNSGLPGPDQPFDMANVSDFGDLGTFSTTSDFSITDMDAFLSMSTSSTGGGSNSPGKVVGPTEQPPAQ